LTLYRITNILNTSLTIEDLGLILSAGESRRITAEAYSRSEDIRRYSRFVRVDTIYVAGQGPITNSGSEKPIVTGPIQKSNLVHTIVKDVAQDTTYLEKKLDDIYSMLSTLMNRKTPEVQQVQVLSKSVETLNDPMFIPSSIVPAGVEFSTQASEQQVDKDIGNSTSALKKLRKK
jgi:hypothetical protein